MDDPSTIIVALFCTSEVNSNCPVIGSGKKVRPNSSRSQTESGLTYRHKTKQHLLNT